jgi:serine protease inhibitor ecotin
MRKILSVLMVAALTLVMAVPVSAQTRGTVEQPKKKVNVSPGAITAMGRMIKSLSDARKEKSAKEEVAKARTSTASTRSTYSGWGR